MTGMGEVVSEDVLDWARDLAALRGLLARGGLQAASAACRITSPGFGANQPPDSGPTLLTMRRSPADRSQACL